LTESEKQGEKTDRAGAVGSTFLWDPVGYMAQDSARMCPLLVDKDVVMLSVGMWFSAAEGSRTEDALQEIGATLRSIADCPSRPRGQKLIFLNMPAHPPRSDHFVREKRDHVTNARMELWSALALPIAREAGWQVVDQFALTTPYVLETLDLDAAHFTGLEALDAVVDEVVAKAGLCDE
jgi:hypothetical protein